MKIRAITAAAALAVAGAAVTTGAVDALTLPSWLRPKDDAASAPARAAPPADANTGAPNPGAAALPPGGVPNFRAVIQSYGPAVVGVSVAGVRNVGGDDGPSIEDDPFFQFFRGLPGFRFGPPQGNVPFRGQGSGFIVSPEGIVLTNAHVVRDARHVTVRLADRREFEAKVLGSDPATDIAVLKIDARNLPTVQLGDPKQLQVGDWVLAIGAPFGFEQTATQGIVSAKGRSLPGDSFVPFIQTDAAVNPGNSGGPLFDGAGRVVGINAQIYSQSGGFQGLAFAIPIDVALHVRDQIVARGHVEHARLGVVLQDLSAPLAESFGLDSPDGALVSSVAPKSAAAAAELKPGDVIVAVDGAPVHTAGDVSSRVGLATPGAKMKLTVWREKARRELDVTLGKAEAAVQQAESPDARGSLGLAARPLSKNELAQVGVDHGLLVERVAGPAAEAGIRPGDVVLALNGKPVDGIEQIRKVLEKRPRHVALLIQRDGQQIFVPVELG